MLSHARVLIRECAIDCFLNLQMKLSPRRPSKSAWVSKSTNRYLVASISYAAECAQVRTEDIMRELRAKYEVFVVRAPMLRSSCSLRQIAMQIKKVYDTYAGFEGLATNILPTG